MCTNTSEHRILFRARTLTRLMFGLVCLETTMTSQETTVRETHHKIWQVKKNKKIKKEWGQGGIAKIKLWGYQPAL